MFEVKEDKPKGLKQGFTITVPHADIETAVTAHLEKIRKTAKIQGFRPGKAPMDLIRQRFGAQATGEVMDKMISDTSREVMEERKLRPAMQPKVDDVSAEEGKDMTFKLDVEVMPEIKPMDFSKLKFTKQVADVDEKTIDEAIERVAKQMRQPEAIKTKRMAKKGDVAIIDFDGAVDGERQEGMKAEKHNLELGSNSFIPGFEEQVIGMKADEEKDVTVSFPDDYQAAHLQGKEAVFAVKLHEIRAHKKIELNDELAKEIGFPALENLRSRISGDISGNYEQVSRSIIKRELMDELEKKHKFELPESLTEHEFNGIWEQLQKDKAEGRISEEDKAKSDDELKKDYQKIAERRVRLGLLLANLAEDNKIEVDQAELRNAMMAEARKYPGQEQAVIEYFTKNREAVERLRAPLLEEKVVDFILEKATVTEKKIPADKLMKLPEDLD